MRSVRLRASVATSLGLGLGLGLALGCGCGHPGAPPAASGWAGDRQAPPSPEGSPRATEIVPSPRDASATHVVLTGARWPGGEAVTLELRDGVIASLADDASPAVPRLELGGRTIVPGVIDSHVHLAYAFGPDDVARGRDLLARRGLVAGVDLAAPLAAMGAFDRTRWLTSGPMITALRGYPTRSWGADGYGRETSGAASMREAIDGLADAGAGLIKVPFGHGPELREAELAALVEHAHARGLKVAAHALLDADVARAAAVGIDVLAHSPLEPLEGSTIEAFVGGSCERRPAATGRACERAVVSTLMAFGGSRVAVDNLRRLHEAGATVLYGTDLGNSPVLGIDVDELALLRRAGLSPQQVLDASTIVPARWWGLSELGPLAPGRAATLLVLDEDPLEDPGTLARPFAVFVDGVRQRPPDE